MSGNARRNAEKLYHLEGLFTDLKADIACISKQNEALEEKILSTMRCVTREYLPDIHQPTTKGEPTQSGTTSDKDHNSVTVSYENCLGQEVTQAVQIQSTQILERTNCPTVPSSSSAVIGNQPDEIGVSPHTPMLVKENVSSPGLLEVERKHPPAMLHNKQQRGGTWAADDKLVLLWSQEANIKNSNNISSSNVKESEGPKVTTAWPKYGARGHGFALKDTDQNDSSCDILGTEFVDKCTELREEHEEQRLMNQDMARSRTTYDVLKGLATYPQRQHSFNVEVPRCITTETKQTCADLMEMTRDDPASGESCSDKLEKAGASKKDIERLVHLLYKVHGMEHHQNPDKDVEEDVRKENEELRRLLSALQDQLALKNEEMLTASNKVGELSDSLSQLKEGERQSAQVIADLQEDVRQAQGERDNLRRCVDSGFGAMQDKIRELKSLMGRGK
ncbi:hypothetical protein PR048_018870 [Dryococelus australis]|uniref:Uncharacterized protein n=1 Tax=Dryococelus australis TaxID=614101 RepID=A0ABQ9H1W1_9NEOP|nr:hypothetical protein PR048_018870 [Dryococelus australis]